MKNGLTIGCTGLTTLLIGLKLNHQADPSWLLALAPLLVPFTLIVATGAISTLQTLLRQVEALDQNGLILIGDDSAEEPVQLDSLKFRQAQHL